MTGIIQNKHQITIDTTPYFASQGVRGYDPSAPTPAATDIRFKVTVDGRDRMVIDSHDYSASGGSPYGRMVFMGDVHIEGTRTYIDALDLRVQDNVILLNKTESTNDTVPALSFSGIEVNRSPGTNAAWLYDEANRWWGPYGPGGDNGTIPTRTLGNIAEIDSRTTPLAGGLTTLYLDTDRLVLRDSSVAGTGHYGSAANPAFTWDGDTDTGLYRNAANEIGFATGGSRRLYLTNNHLITDALTGSLVLPRGTTAQRLNTTDGEVRYNSDIVVGTADDAGVYQGVEFRVANAWIALTPTANKGTFVKRAGDSMTGSLVMRNAAQVLGDDAGTAAAPAFAFDGDADTGMYRTTLGELAFATNAGRRLYITDNHLIADSLTGSLVLPHGTTAQRLTTTDGEIRYNTEKKFLESRQDGRWVGHGYYVVPDNTAMAPADFHNGLTGLDAYKASDQPTQFRTGWTMMHADGLRGAQFTVGWNFHPGGTTVPERATLRVKDDTSTGWSDWRELPWRDEVLLLDGTQAMTGNLSMNSHRITGVADATADGDAVSRKFADDRFVNVSGDTMTGTLNSKDLLPAGGSGTSSVGSTASYYSVGSFDTVNANKLVPLGGSTSQIAVTGGFVSSATYTGTLGTVSTVWGETHVDQGNYNSISVTTITPVNSGTLTLAAGTGGGFFSGAWTLQSGATLQATYADVAERYAADRPYEPGTVVVFGGDAEITASTLVNDRRVAGIISTAPALKLNAEAGPDATHPFVALKGRVPCRAVGPIVKGDLLTTSDRPGHAMRASEARTGTLLGKAIGSLGDGEVGVVEVMVSLM